MDKSYTKLSELVDSDFMVESVGAYKFQMWDNAEKKMLRSDTWEKGYRKVYPVVTDKGQLDMGPGQIGNLLEAVFRNGKADLIGVRFHVKSNGKDGLDRRYFFNPVTDGVDEEPEDM